MRRPTRALFRILIVGGLLTAAAAVRRRRTTPALDDAPIASTGRAAAARSPLRPPERRRSISPSGSQPLSFRPQPIFESNLSAQLFCIGLKSLADRSRSLGSLLNHI